MGSLRGVRRIAGLVLIIVAVLLVAFGAYQLRIMAWDRSTGSVSACTEHSTGTGTKRRVYHDCTVTWADAGQTHQAPVTFDGPADPSGTTQDIVVSGGDAAPAGAAGSGPFIIGFGVLFLLVGLVARLGGRRQE
ncbi:hypothetical protein [Catellatospora sp. TT07R-123]|uniref:hypothetical protein n=1 Tax=Catellatospora sp. TT07R-123 TaxID=2733863 RepID=UPI001BB3C6FA|nr:hypothetical protein [Catellatospora sp. TT07R-123]